jgi:hypothetical protein
MTAKHLYVIKGFVLENRMSWLILKVQFYSSSSKEGLAVSWYQESRQPIDGSLFENLVSFIV